MAFKLGSNITEIHQKNFGKILFAIFLLLFLFEPISKLDMVIASGIRLRAMLKVVFIIFLVISIGFFGFERRVLLAATILMGSFVIGQLFLPEGISVFGANFAQEFLNGDVYILLKYLFIFLFVGVFERLNNQEDLVIRILGIFKKIMLFNTLFVFLGVLLSIDFFDSYPKSPLRFGSQGMFALAGETLYLYIFAIILAYQDFIKDKKIWPLLLLIAAALCLGKKAIFLFLFLMLLVHAYHKQKYYWIGILTLMFILPIIFAQTVMDIVAEFSPFWSEVYNEKGLVSTIFSTRDILLRKCLRFMGEHWSFPNYLFGGQDFFKYRSEFGFFDLFLIFGGIGTLTYLLFIWRYFLKDLNVLSILMIVVVAIVEGLSGGLFINVTPMILFYLTILYLKNLYKTNSLQDA